MRVLHVTSHVDTGGIGQYILSLGRALKDRGVTCAVASGGGDLETELERAGVGTRRIDIRTKFEFAPRVFLASRALARIIGEEGFDVVHAHTRVSQVASVLALRRARAHYVSTCHGYFRPRLSRRIFDTWGERVVAISAPVRAHLESDFGVAPSRIALIHNGIDVEKFSKRYTDPEMAQTRTSLGLGAGPVIGTIGRLSPVKGQPFLIEAMKDIIRHVPSAQCLIVGSGNEEASLKRL
jgi:glycosyltransferase involved in cell wall biosynthesis